MNSLERKTLTDFLSAISVFVFSSTIVACAELYTFYQITQYLTSPETTLSLFNFAFVCGIFIVGYIYNRRQLYQIPMEIAQQTGDSLISHFINGRLNTRQIDKGIIQSLMVDELRRFVHLLVTPSLIIIQRICVLIVYCVAAILILGPAALLAVFFAPLIIGYLIYLMKTKRVLGKKIQHGQFLRSSVSNLLSNDLLHVRSLSNHSVVRKEFNSANELYYTAYRDSSFIVDTQRLVFDIIIFFTFGAILFFPQGDAIQSGFIFILVILLRIAPHLLAIIGNVTVLFVNRDSSVALNEVLGNASQSKSFSKTPMSQKKFIKIIFNNQSFVFKQGVNIVTGPSGCGKSTLLEDLMSPEKSLIDSLEVDDENVDIVDAVFTNNNPLTISGDINSNLTSYDVDIGGLNKFLNLLGMPTGEPLDELLANDSKLSLGQRQRFAFSRAMSSKKRVLIFDETLSGLDQLSFNKIIEILKQSSDNIIIIATHDDRLIKEFGFVIGSDAWRLP